MVKQIKILVALSFNLYYLNCFNFSYFKINHQNYQENFRNIFQVKLIFFSSLQYQLSLLFNQKTCC